MPYIFGGSSPNIRAFFALNPDARINFLKTHPNYKKEYAKAHPEQKRMSDKKYRDAHKLEKSQYDKQYYKIHSIEIKARKRANCLKNKELHKV